MLSFSRIAVVSLVALTGLGATMPAQAAITTFANFTGIDQSSGVRFKNNGTNASNGTGGSLYTIASQTATTPGTRQVKFSFLIPALQAAVSNVTANFTLLANTVTPASTFNGFKIQPNLSGGFSFLSASALTVGSTTYAAGSNLLSGTFNDVTISGQTNATSAGFGGSTGGGATILFTSDFVSFAPGSEFDLSVSLTSLTPVLTSTAGKALRTFRAYSTGSFSAEPAPMANGVPEPSVWGLMIVGFGLVGIKARSRYRSGTKAVAA